jgi:hypothetical protein
VASTLVWCDDLAPSSLFIDSVNSVGFNERSADGKIKCPSSECDLTVCGVCFHGECMCRVPVDHGATA